MLQDRHAGLGSFCSYSLESTFGIRMTHQVKGNGRGVLQKGTVRACSPPRTAKLMGPGAQQGTVGALGAKSELKLSHDVR